MPSPYPYYPLYAADFETDTKAMSATAVGIYIRLLNYQWINGHLPKHPPGLSRIAGCSEKEFTKNWPEIEQKFDVVQGEGRLEGRTLYMNPRLEREREKSIQITEKRRQAGQASGRARQQSLIADDEQVLEQAGSKTRNSQSQQSESSKSKREALPPHPPGLDVDRWEAFMQSRRDNKHKKWAPATMARNMKKLAGLPPDDQAYLLDYSIDGGYRSIYYDRLDNRKPSREQLSGPEQVRRNAARVG